MGLIRDALGSALGANDVKNGFGGPRLPHRSRSRSRSNMSNRTPRDESTYEDNPSNSSVHNTFARDYQRPYMEQYDKVYLQPVNSRTAYSTDILQPRDVRYENDTNILRPRSADDLCHDRVNWQESHYARQSDNLMDEDEPPPYEYSTFGSEMRSERHRSSPRQRANMNYQHSQPEHQGKSRFRPVALPQLTFGDGKPFLRAYSHELQEFGFSSSSFIQIVDAINVAIIPNPEMQIFQKGAGIAGFFV